MTVSAFDQNTQTATVTTEHFVASVNVIGTFTFHIDTINMAAGDFLIARIYQMTLTGGTYRVAYIDAWQGAQGSDDLIKISVPISNELAETNALRFSILQSLGTGRNFPWKVLKHA